MRVDLASAELVMATFLMETTLSRKGMNAQATRSFGTARRDSF